MIVDQLPGYANSSNAYNALLCDALTGAGCTVREYSIKQLVRGQAPDVVHVHWPEFALSDPSPLRARLKLIKLFFGMNLARRRGAKIFWTAHNLRPHDRWHGALESAFYRRWNQTIAGYSCLTKASQSALLLRYPDLKNKPGVVIPHGDYRPRISGKWSRKDAREALQIVEASFVIGSFGVIRPYKNVQNLIEVFLAADMPHGRVRIGGKCQDEERAESIRTLAGNDPRISLEFRFLDDDEMEKQIAACDILAFPYKDILNSGSVLYGLSCNRPCLAPALGSLPELQENVGPDWLQLYEGELTPQILQKAAEMASRTTEKIAPLDRYAWPLIGRETKAAYEKILG